MFEWLKPSPKETEKETEKEDAYLQLSVAKLELPTRVLTGLDFGGIKTIGDLVQRTEKDIMRLRLLGRISIREIKQELARIGLTLAESESPPDQIYESTVIDSLEEKINVMEKATVSGMWKSQEATNIIDRHELQITQLINSVNSVMALEGTVKNLEEEIKQIKENFSLEWKKQYELGVELSNRYRELAGK